MVAVCFQIIYLNKALVNFSTSVVTPLTFVFFSTMTLITSAVLYRGFNVSSAVNGVTIVLGFLVIVVGVGLIFQYNLKLTKLAQELVGEPELEENPLAVIQESFLHEGKHPAFRKQTTRESIPISGSPSATNIRLVSVSGHSLTLPRSRDELVSARNSQTL